jgi:heme/copper-type cytochrome/quinol oxidase subunit 2
MAKRIQTETEKELEKLIGNFFFKMSAICLFLFLLSLGFMWASNKAKQSVVMMEYLCTLNAVDPSEDPKAAKFREICKAQ